MSRWRQHAFETLPELRNLLQKVRERGPYGFFSELYSELVRAYQRKDQDLIHRIYRYSEWCLDLDSPQKTARGHIPTAMCVCFFEHLPQVEMIRQDLKYHFLRAFLIGLREVFLYHGTPEQFEEMIAIPDPDEVLQRAPKRR